MLALVKYDEQNSRVSDSNMLAPKGVELRFGYDLLAPSGCGDADQVGIDSYVLFRSNTTYV